jgi:FlaA1/EpsC-like NDP-sugar epimerase
MPLKVFTMRMFDLKGFIHQHIIQRPSSLFQEDLEQFHSELQQEIHGKKVMVIGGAGSIGSSFIKALVKYHPRQLLVVDINENGLTELVRDLRSTAGLQLPEDFRTYPVDFGTNIFKKLFLQEQGFDIVANFAAHKHVRSEKDVFSIEAMVENNVLKAEKLLDLLKQIPPQHFFCVSTDKAANPVNIMGASKKIMEELVFSYASFFPVTSARFANVAFSNGSLLQGFMERMAKKQPLSSPNDVKRYFVSPEESGQLCLIACVLGRSGEIFFPKMKEDSMKTFSDIALRFLEDRGYEPELCSSEDEARKKAGELEPDSKKYPVYFFSSDTSGEKSYEEFYTGDEDLDFDRFKSLGVIKEDISGSRFDPSILQEFRQAFESDDLRKEDIVGIFSNYISTFEHIETGKNLDQKM